MFILNPKLSFIAKYICISLKINESSGVDDISFNIIK